MEEATPEIRFSGLLRLRSFAIHDAVRSQASRSRRTPDEIRRELRGRISFPRACAKDQSREGSARQKKPPNEPSDVDQLRSRWREKRIQNLNAVFLRRVCDKRLHLWGRARCNGHETSVFSREVRSSRLHPPRPETGRMSAPMLRNRTAFSVRQLPGESLSQSTQDARKGLFHELASTRDEARNTTIDVFRDKNSKDLVRESWMTSPVISSRDRFTSSTPALETKASWKQGVLHGVPSAWMGTQVSQTRSHQSLVTAIKQRQSFLDYVVRPLTAQSLSLFRPPGRPSGATAEAATLASSPRARENDSSYTRERELIAAERAHLVLRRSGFPVRRTILESALVSPPLHTVWAHGQVGGVAASASRPPKKYLLIPGDNLLRNPFEARDATTSGRAGKSKKKGRRS